MMVTLNSSFTQSPRRIWLREASACASLLQVWPSLSHCTELIEQDNQDLIYALDKSKCRTIFYFVVTWVRKWQMTGFYFELCAVFFARLDSSLNLAMDINDNFGRHLFCTSDWKSWDQLWCNRYWEICRNIILDYNCAHDKRRNYSHPFFRLENIIIVRASLVWPDYFFIYRPSFVLGPILQVSACYVGIVYCNC